MSDTKSGEAKSELPELVFDSISVGQKFTESTHTLTAEMVRDYGIAVHNPELERAAQQPAGTVLNDPSLAILFGIPRRVLVRDGRMPPGGVLARQDFELYRPLRLGEEIRTLPSIADKYEKRGRRYAQIRCDLFDQDRQPIGRVDTHVVWAR